MSHDARHWDERYAAGAGGGHQHEGPHGPDPALVQVAAGREPGRALDFAAGRGRHALWLAARGWQVTAVDFSQVAIEEGRAAEARAQHDVTARPVEWVVADATTWIPGAQPGAGSGAGAGAGPGPEPAAYDLILCAFFHLDDDVFPRLRGWLAPDGRLLVVGHSARNLTDGVGGPTDPRYLHTEDRLRAAAEGLIIERLEEVVRPTPAGDQIDIVLLARKP